MCLLNSIIGIRLQSVASRGEFRSFYRHFYRESARGLRSETHLFVEVQLQREEGSCSKKFNTTLLVMILNVIETGGTESNSPL